MRLTARHLPSTAQGQVFQDQFPMAAEPQCQRTVDHDQQLQHVSIVTGVDAKINGDEFWLQGTDWVVRVGSPSTSNRIRTI
jgi:hypothetical protein